MNNYIDYINILVDFAEQSNQRTAVVLRGSPQWLLELVEKIQSEFSGNETVMLGDASSQLICQAVPYHHGHLMLGREFRLILVDLACGFNANSFSALSGTLKGGGLLLFFNIEQLDNSFSSQWLIRAFDALHSIEEGQGLSIPLSPLDSIDKAIDPFIQQQQAIEKILTVLRGHRRRPLILSADRGRGKTSALGLAAAKAMREISGLRILLCAPNPQAVKSAFFHANNELREADLSNSGILRYGGSIFEFIAPDALLAQQPSCDLLLVDEAASIPLPMLQSIVEHYHRVVFSSTLHGYEGCGLGFTFKFMQWLELERPGFTHFHLSQPIRWAENDYLENWLNQTFFINIELNSQSINSSELPNSITYREIQQQELFSKPNLFAQLFSILVNAHYQTTPNDMMLILSSEQLRIVVVEHQESILGCALICREGNMPPALIDEVKQGIRRPKGQLVPVTLVNQLGMYQQAELSCDRIMRIAIHPNWQRIGLGCQLMNYIHLSSDADYLATSFGLTSELFHFWGKNDFRPIKLGTHKDHVSGTYSILMVRSDDEWLEKSVINFAYVFSSMLLTSFSDLSPKLVACLLESVSAAQDTESVPMTLIEHYSLGGSTYESVEVWLRLLIITNFSSVSELMIARILQNREWTECAKYFHLMGRKQTEKQLRQDIANWFANLHCKELSPPAHTKE